MRPFLSFIVLALIAVAAAIGVRFDPGNVVLFYPPYRVDLSLNLFAILAIVLFFVTLWMMWADYNDEWRTFQRQAFTYQAERDKDRDNVNLAVDDANTYRFGPASVTERACESAALVAATLRRNGWPDAPRPCKRPGCVIAASRGSEKILDRQGRKSARTDPRSFTPGR